MKLLVKRVLQAAFVLAVVGAIVYAFLPKPVDVDLTTVTHGPLRVTVDEDGKTRIKERYVVSAPLAGELQRIDLRAGDPVEAGKTVLAVIEPSDPTLLDARSRAEAEARVRAAEKNLQRASTQVERARAEEQAAKAELDRMRLLRVSQSSSQKELDEATRNYRTAAEDLKGAQFAVHIAEFELDLAKAALLRGRPPSPGETEAWRLEIHSPIHGRLLHVFQESAAVVTPGTRLLELGDPADLECEIDVLSSDAVKIAPGAKVLLEHWGGDKPLRGEVRRVEPAAFTKVSALGVEEQRVYVLVDFVDPPEQRKTLGDAYRVEARIVIWESEDVLKLPAGALFRHGDSWAVYQAVEGKALLRPLRIGRNNGLEAEVLDGLEQGDEVVVHPSDKVTNGVAIVRRQNGQ